MGLNLTRGTSLIRVPLLSLKPCFVNILCMCVYVCAVMEFKQRQPEVERSQVITSLRIGEGGHATVSSYTTLPFSDCIVDTVCVCRVIPRPSQLYVCI